MTKEPKYILTWKGEAVWPEDKVPRTLEECSEAALRIGKELGLTLTVTQITGPPFKKRGPTPRKGVAGKEGDH